jgi:MFS family permease
VFLVQWATSLQREVPRELLARVISLDWLCSFSLMPLGQVLVGPAVDAFGREAVLWTGAVVVVVTTLAALLVPGVMDYSTGRPALDRVDDEQVPSEAVPRV